MGECGFLWASGDFQFLVVCIKSTQNIYPFCSCNFFLHFSSLVTTAFGFGCTKLNPNLDTVSFRVVWSVRVMISEIPCLPLLILAGYDDKF